MITVHARRALIFGQERANVWITFGNGVVQDVAAARPTGPTVVNIGDADVIPGLVDLHSDCLELRARPRASMELPLSAALLDLDAEVAMAGITTHFVCVCIEDDLGKYRSVKRAIETVDVVETVAPALRVDHRVHLRVDVTGDGLATTATLAQSPLVGLLSYMLHLPGLGQFSDEESWRRYYTTVEGETDGAVAQRLATRKSRLNRLHDAQRHVSTVARANAAVLASHDDDSVDGVQRAVELGARIAEFPVNREAAQAAAGAGLEVVMGAPNARKGLSHHGNLSAREALENGWLSVLASDYHPPSLLAAAYELADGGISSWAESIALVTEAPARAAGLADRGSIAPGQRADLVAVTRRAGMPAVAHLWAAGEEVI